jgi:hypothetical protein
MRWNEIPMLFIGILPVEPKKPDINNPASLFLGEKTWHIMFISRNRLSPTNSTSEELPIPKDGFISKTLPKKDLLPDTGQGNVSGNRYV